MPIHKLFQLLSDIYSATFAKNTSRSSLRVSSTSATVSGETRPVSPIHLKNFLTVAYCYYGLILAAYAFPYLSSLQKTRGYRATDVHLYLTALLGALESPPPLFRTPACHRQGFPIIFLFIEDHSDVKICLVA
jgi:hypothetical protein